MQLSNGHLEVVVKKELSKLYKGAYGKGPDDTEVNIYENFVFLKFYNALTPIEEALLKSQEGKVLVEKIRDELILIQSSEYIPTLERIVKGKVQNINYILDEENKLIYIFVMFEEVIGKNLN